MDSTKQWHEPSQVLLHWRNAANYNESPDGDNIYLTTSAFIPLSALPVSLIYFEAKHVQRTPTLTWATASEVNSQDFDIERSASGQVFTKIGTVKATGSNSNYTFLDKNPLSIAYYRLKSNDLDGKFEYSKTISIESQSSSNVRVKPTFVHDVLTVEGATAYEIIDGAGRVLLQSIENQLNVQSLSPGFYVVRGCDERGNPFVQKIIKN